MVHRDLKLENILVSTANPDVQFDIKVTKQHTHTHTFEQQHMLRIND